MENENNKQDIDPIFYLAIAYYVIPLFIAPLILNFAYVIKYFTIGIPIVSVFMFIILSMLYDNEELGSYQLPIEKAIKELNTNKYVMALSSRNHVVETIIGCVIAVYTLTLIAYDHNFLLLILPFSLFNSEKYKDYIKQHWVSVFFGIIGVTIILLLYLTVVLIVIYILSAIVLSIISFIVDIHWASIAKRIAIIGTVLYVLVIDREKIPPFFEDVRGLLRGNTKE